jgi:hypothetical protein
MMSGSTKASLLGEPAQVALERALSEFRSDRRYSFDLPATPCLGAKATRAGHLPDHVLCALAEPAGTLCDP